MRVGLRDGAFPITFSCVVLQGVGHIPPPFLAGFLFSITHQFLGVYLTSLISKLYNRFIAHEVRKHLQKVFGHLA